MNHLSEQQLVEYLDRTLGDADSRSVDLHLQSCIRCAQKMRKLELVDKLIRQSFVERAPSHLTGKVIEKLGIPEAPSLAWDLLKYLAPVVALLIVGAIVLAVFKYAGIFDQPGIQSSLQSGQSAYSLIRDGVHSGAGVFSGWMKSVAPFAFVGKGFGLTAFLCFFLVVLGVVDRFFIAPLVRKGRQA